MTSELDVQFLRRAIRLAMNGRGSVEPNPMVGCVLVKNGQIIGEGFHPRFGGPHAEPTALSSCSTDPAGATAYVTLEPCCHTNKKTPPCVPALIKAKISRVVLGTVDPNPDVDGKGIAQLQAAGIAVDTGVLQKECQQLLAPFIGSTQRKRPYVTMKWAQSANHQVAGPMGKAVHITNEHSDRLVHLLRSRCDAIAVGTNTVLNDDPLLTARGVENPRKLLRVVLSNSLKIPTTSRLVFSAREAPVVVYCSRSCAKLNEVKVRELRNYGVEVVELPDHENHFAFPDVATDLHARGVQHLLIEPGPTLVRYFLSRGQADRVWVFRSPKPIEDAGGFASSIAPTIDYPPVATLNIHGDELTEYLNPQSDLFFSPQPSADMVLASEQVAP